MPARKDEFDDPWEPVVWIVFAFGLIGWALFLWRYISTIHKPQPTPIFYSANQKPVDLLDKDGKVIACKIEGLDKDGFVRWVQVQCPGQERPLTKK